MSRIRKGIVNINEVLELIHKGKYPDDSKCREIVLEESVKVSSTRLLTFKRTGTVCHRCKLEASFFAVEKIGNNEHYNLELYGVKDGKEVLFTKGKRTSNSTSYTTLCESCNNKLRRDRALRNKEKP